MSLAAVVGINFVAGRRKRGSVRMSSGKGLTITLVALVLVHAGGAHASADDGLCRKQVQKTKLGVSGGGAQRRLDR
jgi:hypothetical protein